MDGMQKERSTIHARCVFSSFVCWCRASVALYCVGFICNISIRLYTKREHSSNHSSKCVRMDFHVSGKKETLLPIAIRRLVVLSCCRLNKTMSNLATRMHHNSRHNVLTRCSLLSTHTHTMHIIWCT